jgi:CheY-like chemotaxis protein
MNTATSDQGKALIEIQPQRNDTELILSCVDERPYHIVIADDDDDDQFIIKEAVSELHDRQIRVTSLYDGLQLLDYLQQKGSLARDYQRPDLILLDINMPLLNGLEALEKIKQDSELKSIPVCLISTVRTEEHKVIGKQLGAEYFYSKPNRIGAYKAILEEIFSGTIYQINS